MKVLFRADASLSIGSGHVMRCLTLAQGLTDRGHHCEFIVRKCPDNQATLITDRGFTVHELPPIYDCEAFEDPKNIYLNWLGCSLEQDAMAVKPFIDRVKPDWVVIDHYALDARWTKALQSDSKFLVIDDLANRQHQCDLLLDQTLGRVLNDYSEFVPPHCKVLAGARYALLRPEFSELRQYSIDRRTDISVQQVLVNLGGVDKDNVTEQVLEVLARTVLGRNSKIVAVLGGASPWKEEIREALRAFPDSELRINETQMARLMADSDIAIGAAGSTSWERCCVGLPSIMVVLAENQKKVAYELERVGAAIVLKEPARLNEELKEVLCSLSSDTDNTLSRMTQKALEVTSGDGCAKVIRAMESMVKAN